ncbi:DNA polymerase III subunit beta [Acholeplasma oculi]|uniref:Beta sliding clamp n=1 Tax=Acholeplasma oculi TaxID=35623 RepID=A0A061A848_9MOLU|nr:DNA polymerase III subunit beta [Acholeplasma oculi]CDR30075.1 DNA polymerase III, beta subunit [Acholeplasma oculi]SKC49956.1 DNA polymerase III, beta subunit [Acholeplasma oculi]SUT88279.1 DNA polymerase III subunit beta [Acholeplasma oculi]
MNFTIDRDILLNNLIHVQKGLPNKTPLPILYAIKFEVFSDYIQLTASNSDVAIQVLVDDSSLKVHKTGKIALPGRYFIDIIRKVAASRIEIVLQEERLLVIKADRSEFKLKLMDVEDYPDVDFLDLAEPVILSSDMIKEIIKATNFATADNEKRPILTGVNFKYQDNHLYAVATDSYRLSQKNLSLRTHSKTFNIVIPNKSLDELSKILDHIQEEIEVYINPNKVLFKMNKIWFQTRLLEGTYPDTFKIIPTTFPTVISFNKEELLSAVDRVSLLSPRDKESNYNIIKLTLRQDQVVEISSTNTEIGDAKEEIIPTSDVVGGLISIAFSSKYLNEALKAFNSTEVTLNFAGEIKPFVIKGNMDSDLLHLILPVRID